MIIKRKAKVTPAKVTVQETLTVIKNLEAKAVELEKILAKRQVKTNSVHYSDSKKKMDVARLLSMIRERLSEILTQYIFEPNDEETRISVVKSVKDSLSTIPTIEDYSVFCSSENNSPTDVENNQLNVRIAFKPVDTKDFIYMNANIQ
jgi:hypothetical protein